MARTENKCSVEIRRILEFAGSDEDTAIEAFHHLVDTHGCGEVRRALAAVSSGKPRATRS